MEFITGGYNLNKINWGYYTDNKLRKKIESTIRQGSRGNNEERTNH